jgi:hypothetical protein
MRIFTDGAERQDMLFWDIPGGSVVARKSSPYCYNVGGSTKHFTVVAEGYWRVRVHWSGEWGWDKCNRLPRFLNTSSEIGYISEDGSDGHHLRAIFGDCNLISTKSLQLDTAYLIEIYIKISATVGRVVVKLDGNIVIDYTGNTGTTLINGLWFGNFNYGNFYVDDLAMNDTSNDDGKGDNSWCGDGVIVKLIPTGDGTHSNFHGSDENDVDNFEMVDDFANDGDTTYVFRDAVDTGVQQQFAMDNNFDAAGKIITRIFSEATARKTAAEEDVHIKIGTLADGGDDAVSSNQDLWMDYTRIVGPDQKVNPVTDLPWTKTDIDAIEFVSEIG